MKTLHIINSLTSGGAEKLVANLASKQAQENTVGVFTFVNTNEVFFEQMHTNVITHKAKGKRYFALSNIFRLFKAIKKYDIIHVHLFPAFYLTGVVSLFFWNKKFIYTEHSNHNKRRSKKYRLIEKCIYSRYQTVICISKSVEESLNNWMHIPHKTIIIENFLDQNEIEQQKPLSKEQLSYTANDSLIVMVGSFRDDNSKDQITVIKALDKLPENFKLLFIGQGVLLEKTKTFVAQNNLTNRVQFLGFRADVYSVLKACEYGVLSSNWEGFGIALIEYMACDLVAIATRVEGLKDLAVSPKNLFEVGDYKGLANQILYFESHPEEAKRIKEIQFEFIKKFSLTQSVTAHQKVYEEKRAMKILK